MTRRPKRRATGRTPGARLSACGQDRDDIDELYRRASQSAASSRDGQNRSRCAASRCRMLFDTNILDRLPARPTRRRSICSTAQIGTANDLRRFGPGTLCRRPQQTRGAAHESSCCQQAASLAAHCKTSPNVPASSFGSIEQATALTCHRRHHRRHGRASRAQARDAQRQALPDVSEAQARRIDVALGQRTGRADTRRWPDRIPARPGPSRGPPAPAPQLVLGALHLCGDLAGGAREPAIARIEAGSEQSKAITCGTTHLRLGRANAPLASTIYKAEARPKGPRLDRPRRDHRRTTAPTQIRRCRTRVESRATGGSATAGRRAPAAWRAAAPCRHAAPASCCAGRQCRRSARTPAPWRPTRRRRRTAPPPGPCSLPARRSLTMPMKTSCTSRCSSFSRATSSGRSGWNGIERALVLARGVHAPLDAEAVDELVEAEAGRDHADGADDRGRIGVDLVARQRQEVAARGGHVLAEHVDALVLLLGQLADAAEDQVRLHRRAAGRVDHDGHGRQLGEREGLLDRAGDRARARPGRSGVTMPIGPEKRSTGTTGPRLKKSIGAVLGRDAS